VSAMAILLHPLSQGDGLEAFARSAGMGLIAIGTLWLGEPNRFNARARRAPMGIAFLAAVSHALLMAAPGS